MRKEEFAALITGHEYRKELTPEQEKLAEESGLLVCFVASDDLMELRGIIYDEFDAYEGGAVFLGKKKGGIIGAINKTDLEEIYDLMDDKGIGFLFPSAEIIAEFAPDEPSCSWLIKTDLPHATFDIMEDGELYCRGVVIEKSDIINFLNQQK